MPAAVAFVGGMFSFGAGAAFAGGAATFGAWTAGAAFAGTFIGGLQPLDALTLRDAVLPERIPPTGLIILRDGQMAFAFETVYGTPPASGYRLMSFARTTLGARPRDLRPTRSSRQLCALSRTPTWNPTSSFFPSGVAPRITSMHSACGSIRA